MMWVKRILFGCFIIGVVNIVQESASSDIQFCQAGNETCILNTMTRIFRTKYEGFPYFGLSEFDPLRFSVMTWKGDGQTDFTLEINFFNCSHSGLSHASAVEVRGFEIDIQNLTEIHIQVPYINLDANYTATGTAFNKTFNGKGRGGYTLRDLSIWLRNTGGPIIRNGEVYLNINNTELDFTTDTFRFNLENLMDGNASQSLNLENLLNDHWDQVLFYMRNSINIFFATHYEKLMKEVFSSHPYKKLFLNSSVNGE